MSDPFAVALPTGTVTFVFTDVEGSTRLLRELGDAAYEQALREHRAALRSAFETNRGVEVDTQGDAFFVAFSRASDAVAAATAVIGALDGGPIRVRVGIHTGEPLASEESYVGIDVHRAARIAAVGHGGQVLVSQTTRDLVPDADLRDLGEHRLKDLTRPERLYQLGAGDFPPLRSLNRTNLPVAAGPLIGRVDELRQITQLIDQGHRLVTLTGPGGSGKTRLALQAAAELVEDYPDGVFFAALAPLDDAARVGEAVASALGLSVDADVLAALASKRALIVLDNAEHLDIAEFVALLLGAARDVVVLVTSRAPLHLSVEYEVSVEPLAVEAAVALFVARAAAVGRHVDADESVAAVCRRVDCLPLAVELAAVRTKHLAPGAILQRLDRVLPLLTGGSRDVPDRQRTLRATIDWSYSLLPAELQDHLRSLAVFRGSFSVDAAAAVAGADLDSLAALVDCSLLKALGDDRFLMLETIREYAAEKLAGEDERSSVVAAHVRHYLAEAAEVGPLVDSAVDEELLEAMSLLQRDLDNIDTAFGYALEVDEPLLVMRAAAAMATFWQVRGGGLEALRALEAEFDDDAPARLRLDALRALAALRRKFRDFDGSVEAAEAFCALAAELGATEEIARGLHMLALDEWERGDLDSAMAHQLEAIRISPAPRWRSLGMLSTLLLEKGDLRAAREYAVAAIDVSAATAGTSGDPLRMVVLSPIAYEEGDANEAAELVREHLALLALYGGESLAEALCLAARFAADIGLDREAALLLGGIDRLSVGFPRWAERRSRGAPMRTREALGVPAFDDLYRGGTRLSDEDLLDIAANVLDALTAPDTRPHA